MQVKATQKSPRQSKVSPEGEREEGGERFRDRQVITLKFGLHTKISKFMNPKDSDQTQPMAYELTPDENNFKVRQR